MARSIFPLFERHRILKKELLWALRDYSYGFMRLEYEAYADGILTGLELGAQDGAVVLGTGMVKYGDSVVLFEKPELVPCEAREVYVCLKLKMRREKVAEDFIVHEARPFLDADLERKEDEIEVCRFKLKAGAQLRTQYTDFFDMETEFDTVNLAEATWAGIGAQSLCPAITRRFALEAMRCGLTDARDLLFCNLALQTTKALHRMTIAEYVRSKLELEEEDFANRQLFEHLALILRNLREGTELRPPRRQKKKRQIFVE